MNWEAINAISQFVSSLAVVCSLLYLAIQVHRSTRVAKVAAQDSAAAAVREVTGTFMENADMARIWRAGLEDLDSLSAEEQARFFHATHQFLKAFETIHFHHTNRLMDEQLWRGWQELLRHYLVAPGIAHYWDLRTDLFSERFQKYVSELEKPTKGRTVGNLLGGEMKTDYETTDN
jgi:hypothetical protein